MSNRPTDIEHPNSTKKSIAYSQELRFNEICYNRSDFHNNCKRLLIKLTKRGYNKTDTTTQINYAITVLSIVYRNTWLGN